MLGILFGPAAGTVVIIYIGLVVLTIVAWTKILAKAGYSGWWVLIGFVPLVNVIMFFVFAFAKWPVLEDRGGSPGDVPWPKG